MDFLDELLTFTPRGARYFAACIIVVAGVVCGALINSSVGGTVCTVLAVVGCLALIRMIVVDVGWVERAETPQDAERDAH